MLQVVMLSLVPVSAASSLIVPQEGPPQEGPQEKGQEQKPVAEPAPAAPLTADDLFTAWERLEEKDRLDTVQWFIAECDRSKTFRSRLEQFILSTVEGPMWDWPEAKDPPRFDPKVHTPAQIIKRRFVNVLMAPHSKAFKRLQPGLLTRPMTPAVTYDWARGELVSHGKWDDLERIARNAALGYSPYTDLVDALVERALDDRSFKDQAEAFGHAYSSRNGKAFRQVTLYEAWSSGAELEMPDVECLGIIHALEDDWTTYVAPVSPSQHSGLYAKIAKHFSGYRKHRDLRMALARSYLHTEIDLPAGYRPVRDTLHGIWELHGAQPSALAGDLPSNDDWKVWIERTGNKVATNQDLVARRLGRVQELSRSKDWARRTFQGILTEYGAFESKAPAADEAPPSDGGTPDDGSGKAPSR